MSRARFLAASTVIIALIASSVYCIVLDTEYWPFSQYPMFSGVMREHSLSKPRVYGITHGQPPREIPMYSSDYIEPFDQSRFSSALMMIGSEPNSGRRQRLLKRALLDCLRRYEKLRRAEQHDGPPLRGVRLYHEHWQLDDHAQNVDQPNYRKKIAKIDKQALGAGRR
jgi:hypothetical protein